MLAEIILISLAFLLLVIELFFNKKMNTYNSLIHHTSWVGLIIVLLAIAYRVNKTQLMLGSYQLTPLNNLILIVLASSSLFTILMNRRYFETGGDNSSAMKHHAEYNISILLVTVGMFNVVCAQNLLHLFVGLELATIPLYFLAAFDTQKKSSSEAAFKYIILGSISTTLMLFGFSYIYGFAGGVQYQEILTAVQTNPNSPLLWVGVLFTLSAIGFKLSLFPFHFWTADVYHGAPSPTTAFLSVSSKTTGIILLVSLLSQVFTPIYSQLTPLIMLLAAATMLIGNLGALKQSHFRRFMGFSSIAQAGYLIFALTGPIESARESIVFYLLIYSVSNYGLFYLFSVIGKDRGEEFSSLRGLSKESPILAAMLSLCVFSLAGIPPVAGFIGKLMLFASAAESHHYFMIIFAAANSTIGLYYYLQLLKEAYITPANEPQIQLDFNLQDKFVLSVLALGILFIGIFPHWSQWVHQFALGFQ